MAGRCKRMLRELFALARPRTAGHTATALCQTGSLYRGACRHVFKHNIVGMASASTPPRVVAVVSPPDNPALAAMPSIEGVEFIVGDDLATFQASPRLPDTSAVMFLPPASPALLPELWPLTPNVKWFHSFFAGVDSLSGFFPTLIKHGIPLSNGRGAFSVSCTVVMFVQCQWKAVLVNLRIKCACGIYIHIVKLTICSADI